MAEKIKMSERILEAKPNGNGTSPGAVIKPRKRKARRRRRRSHAARTRTVSRSVERPFPRVTLEDALKVAMAIKDKNGGNPYASEDVAAALKVGARGSRFFYLTAGARDYGLTTGTRDTEKISLMWVPEILTPPIPEKLAGLRQ